MHRSGDGGHAVVAAPSLHMLLVLLFEVLVASVRPHLLVAVVHLVLDVRSVVAVDVALLLVALLDLGISGVFRIIGLTSLHWPPSIVNFNVFSIFT